MHDPAHRRWNLDTRASVNQLPSETDVSCVHKEEDRRIKRNRLRRQSAHSHPSRREGKQRHRKQMREIELQQARGRLRGITHQIMVIGPHDGDEQVAYCIAQLRGPEQQKGLESRKLRRSQFQTNTVIRTAKTQSENALSRSGVALSSRAISFLSPTNQHSLIA